MVKFFREIRHTQMAQGKSKWYLIYAVGEVFLVVLGILIALQVNNWNENRKNAKLERTILENLQAELNANLEQLENKIRGCRNDIRADSILISYVGSKNLSSAPWEIDSLLTRITAPPTFDPADGVMKNLFNSGNINVIRNEELKSSLSSWESNLNEAKEIEDYLIAFCLGDLTIYLNDKIPFQYNTRENLGSTSFLWQRSSIFNDVEFENLIVRSNHFENVLKERYMILREEMLIMSGIIESELSGN